MPFSINTNVASLQAENYLRINSDFQSKTINRVTSGLRIVSSGDDAAGLAIANGYRSDQAVLIQGIRNANDGLSQLQIADGGMNNISQLLDRARTLAAQSASGTFTGDRNVLNSEFQSLIGEIDRQAKAIGLNRGGTFAKDMAVFIGGGKGNSDASIIANGSVALDLSKSTVDTNSLGLNTYRALNAKTYDLSTTSDTSVAKIIANAGTSTAHFYFRGAGFGDAAGSTGEIDVSISTTGITDTAGLAAAINQAIYNQANPGLGSETTATKAFKAAGISASVVTDANGREQLAFSSSSAAFQVHGDQLGNAFLGNIADSRVGRVTGEGATYAVAENTLNTLDTSTSASTVTVQFTIGGTAGSVITLTSVNGTLGTALSAQDIVDRINNEIQANGTAADKDIHAELKNGKLAFYQKDGKEFSFHIANDTGGLLGFDVTAGAYTGTSRFNGLNSGGVYQSAQEASTTSNTDYSTSAYFWKDLLAGETQTITVNAKRADGSQTGIDIPLIASGTPLGVSTAIDTINDALQNSQDPYLQGIVAVRDEGGIRFLNSQQEFSVKLGTEPANGDGLYEIVNGFPKQQGAQIAATEQGEGGAVDISSQSAAQNAVTALAGAVAVLGQAQAVIGRGENQFNYAINLAQSQSTNLASAESRIRDADLATEAANLTKAQILMQAGVAALAQANSAPQQVLSLLKS
ncbi:MAG TPA: flagellin [Bryobacteraceae bacterium]|jgi:flagellin|nr:flagellin [Bryobacteraceae bacterium]